MRILKRSAILLAALVAASVAGAGPALAASSGWVFHSRHHIDDLDDAYGVECAAAGQALVSAGTAQDYRCHIDATRTNFDLFVITGTWLFHSRHHIDSLADRYGVECTAAGQAVVAAGNAFTYQCRIAPGGADWDLYVIS